MAVCVASPNLIWKIRSVTLTRLLSVYLAVVRLRCRQTWTPPHAWHICLNHVPKLMFRLHPCGPAHRHPPLTDLQDWPKKRWRGWRSLVGVSIANKKNTRHGAARNSRGFIWQLTRCYKKSRQWKIMQASRKKTSFYQSCGWRQQAIDYFVFFATGWLVYWWGVSGSMYTRK